MKNFKTSENLSLQECYDILHGEEMFPNIEEVKARYKQELERWHAKELQDFSSCKKIEDFEHFIARYDKYVSFYTMQNRKAALETIEDLFWKENNGTIKGCNIYLGKYPQGKHSNRAKQEIADIIKKRKIAKICILVVAAIVFIIGFRPIGSLELSNTEVYFSKYGGEQNISITTKTNKVYIYCNANWLSTDYQNGTLILTALENPNDTRYEEVEIDAFATFYGNAVYSKTKVISVKQESGLPSYFRVSKESLSFNKWGNAKKGNKFTIETDGVGLNISCPEDKWQITQQNKSRPNSPKIVECTLSVGENSSDTKNVKIKITSGNRSENINVYQESGLATKFKIDKTDISVPIGGSPEGRGYWVNVITDGTTYDTRANRGWIHITKYNSHKDNHIEITVDANPDEVRSGTIYLSSNIGHTSEITIKQDGDPSKFYASSSSYTFDTDGGSKYFSIENNSSKEVSCSKNKSWLSATIDGSRVKVSCEANLSSPPREGIVTLYCGNKTTTIDIHQKGWKKCTYCDEHGKMPCDKVGAYYLPDPDHVGVINHREACQKWSYIYNMWMSTTCDCSKCGGGGKIKCKYCDGKRKVKTN